MKMTVAQGLRFLQVAIGDGDKRGALADYFEDLLGMGVPPTVDIMSAVLKWKAEADPAMEQMIAARVRIAGTKRFVGALRGLADCLDPDMKPAHPNDDEPMIDLDKDDDDPA